MFVCRECWRRAFPAVSRPIRQLNATHWQQAPISSQRSFATAALVDRREDGSQSETGTTTDASQESSVEIRPPSRLTWVVKKHLEHLKDPFAIAERVRETLAKDRFEEAALLTRTASRDAQCTVSWNHLIEYQMKNQKLRAAIKLYNEMKKRAQRPNAQTYTIIFKGCATSEHPKLAVSEAVRIYHSMMSNERLNPNTIHLNAVIEVCARAEDLESMFSIVKTANDGLRAPSNWTYTLILNALRRTSEKPHRQLSDEETERNKQTAIQRSRAIWEEAISRWRAGKIVIDEETVCAMGRVLLMGGFKENNDVLSLVEQTMKIPNLDRGDGAAQIPNGTPKQKDLAQESSNDLVVRKKNFNTSRTAKSTAVPSNNTLSLVLKALGNIRKTSLGPAYWDLFTKVYNVSPDADNYHELLRLLRLGRASAKSAEVLGRMPPKFMGAKSFRIALSACARDGLNDNAFDSACKILDVMVANTRVPEPHALRLFLHVAGANRQGFKHLIEKGDAEGAKFALGTQIVRGLDRIWEPFKRVQASSSYQEGNSHSPEQRWAWQYDVQREAVAVARKIIAACDKVVTEGMATEDVIRTLKTRRNILNRYVVRFCEKRDKMEPNLRRYRDRDGDVEATLDEGDVEQVGGG